MQKTTLATAEPTSTRIMIVRCGVLVLIGINLAANIVAIPVTLPGKINLILAYSWLGMSLCQTSLVAALAAFSRAPLSSSVPKAFFLIQSFALARAFGASLNKFPADLGDLIQTNVYFVVAFMVCLALRSRSGCFVSIVEDPNRVNNEAPLHFSMFNMLGWITTIAVLLALGTPLLTSNPGYIERTTFAFYASQVLNGFIFGGIISIATFLNVAVVLSDYDRLRWASWRFVLLIPEVGSLAAISTLLSGRLHLFSQRLEAMFWLMISFHAFSIATLLYFRVLGFRAHIRRIPRPTTS